MSDVALEEPAAPPANEPPTTPPAAPPAASAPPAPAATPPKTPPVAAAPPAPPPEPDAYWKEDWRARIAGTDDKRNPKRKTLERFADPAAIFNSYEELRSRFDAGGLVKVPGEKATDEERAAFVKAIGWTEKPDEMLQHIKLENGLVVGDADKPVLNGFLQAVHGATSAQDFVNRTTNWYFKNEEEQANALDEADETFRGETERTLKEEYGPTFNRYRNAIKSLFETSPGGSNPEDSLFASIMASRMPDGNILGNHPDAIRWLVGMVREVKPLAAVTEDASGQGQNVDDEIAAIEKRMRDDRQGYFKDEKAQKRYRELLDAQTRNRARNAA